MEPDETADARVGDTGTPLYRRTVLVTTSAGLAALAGCTTSNGVADTDTAPTRTPTPTATSTATATLTPTATSTPAAPAVSVEDLSGPTVTSSGTGTGVTDRFTARGGPVVVSMTFDYTGMRNSNFIVQPLDVDGERQSTRTLWVNEVFDETRLEDDPGVYRLRAVTHFEPGDYFFDVKDAGGVFGDGAWEVTVEQPGVPTADEAVTPPTTVEGFDADVVGPVAFDGPVRMTVETTEPRLGASGDPLTYNYRTIPTDHLGVKAARLLNSVETAPLTQSAVFFPDEGVTVGYFDVHSWGPWTATVEPA